ncbi:TOBE domain-containing protein [Nocardioides sp. GY 10127]|nr:TOBE domain-containing protein [Nocardioides sp. GY 10127]
MQMALKEIQRATGVTFLYVTHDQEEAFTMSDRIGFMHAGELVQVAPPTQMYHQPGNARVADFVGTANTFPVLSKDDATVVAEHFKLPAAEVAQVPDAAGTAAPDGWVVVVRPESLRVLGPASPRPCVCLEGTVADLSFKGSYTSVKVTLPSGDLVANADLRTATGLALGEPVRLGFDAQDAWVCPAVPAA